VVNGRLERTQEDISCSGCQRFHRLRMLDTGSAPIIELPVIRGVIPDGKLRSIVLTSKGSDPAVGGAATLHFSR
jgi:hypothetical protein